MILEDQSIERAEFGDETHAAIKVKTLLGAMYLSLEPSGSGQLAEGTEIPVDRTSSPYDVIDAFSGLGETSEEIDTDQLAKSLTTLADLTRNTPEEFRHALDGVSRLSSNIAARDEQINSLLKNLERVSTVLNERDEDIVGLMKDSEVLFRALVQRRDAVHNLLVSTSTLSKELTLLVQQSRADLKPALTHLEGGFLELIGPRNPVDALAAKAGTIGYEILTSLGNRYARAYAEPSMERLIA